MNQKDIKSKHENMAVYETLRNSIISGEERITNEKIYMYVVYFALLALYVESGHSWMILITYLVLAVFQTLINGERIAVEKTSTYIRVFFENNSDIHWETLHKEQHYLRAYLVATRNIGWYMEKHGSSSLAIVSFLILLITSLQQFHSFCLLPSNLVIELIIAFFSCIFVIGINGRLYINNGDTGGELENDIREFYKKYYGLKEYTEEALNSEDE